MQVRSLLTDSNGDVQMKCFQESASRTRTLEWQEGCVSHDGDIAAKVNGDFFNKIY